MHTTSNSLIFLGVFRRLVLIYPQFYSQRPRVADQTHVFAFTLLARFTISAALFWTEIRAALLIESGWLIKSFLGVGSLIWLAGLNNLILTIYRASVGLSLKGLSLKNGEIETSSEACVSSLLSISVSMVVGWFFSIGHAGACPQPSTSSFLTISGTSPILSYAPPLERISTYCKRSRIPNTKPIQNLVQRLKKGQITSQVLTS